MFLYYDVMLFNVFKRPMSYHVDYRIGDLQKQKTTYILCTPGFSYRMILFPVVDYPKCTCEKQALALVPAKPRKVLIIATRIGCVSDQPINLQRS